MTNVTSAVPGVDTFARFNGQYLQTIPEYLLGLQNFANSIQLLLLLAREKLLLRHFLFDPLRSFQLLYLLPLYLIVGVYPPDYVELIDGKLLPALTRVAGRRSD